MLHQTQIPAFLLPLRDNTRVPSLREPRLQRAIGVIYRPDTERVSHYFTANLPLQFDAVLHFDETRAVSPRRTAGWEEGELRKRIRARCKRVDGSVGSNVLRGLFPTSSRAFRGGGSWKACTAVAIRGPSVLATGLPSCTAI